MFTSFTDAAIDAVQSTKKNIVNTVVLHKGIADALNQFVDAQTSYTKAAVAAGTQTATSIGLIVSSKQFFDDVTKTVKSFVPTPKKG